MNRSQFYQYLENFDALNNKSLKRLRELVEEYPYFQLGRMLLVKNLHILDDIKYEQELKLTSVHIPDRKKLFLMIHDTVNNTELDYSETVEEQKQNITEEKESKEVLIRPEETSYNPENYFNVSDEIDSDGLTINFSGNNYNQKQKQKEEQEEEETHDFTFQHDLLSNTSGYQFETSTYNKNEIHSFTDWLNAMNQGRVAAKKEEESPINNQMQLIESFLQKSREKIVPNSDKESKTEDVAALSADENEELMTETLANIHIKQKHYEKAIIIFEKLSLKYPEKNIYFASRIKELDKLISNQ